MRREGSLNIVCLNHGRPGQANYHLSFSDYAAPNATSTPREIAGEDALRAFLHDQLKIHPDAIAVALKTLKTEPSASIFHTTLSDEELVSLGLKPPAPPA